MEELHEYHRELLAEVQRDADAMGMITTEAFLEIVAEILDEAGEVSSLSQAYHSGKHGAKAIQVDAYAWDPADDEGVLSLIICDFNVADDLQSILKADINKLLTRLVEFVVAARTREFREKLEETSNAFVLSDLITRVWKQIRKIKLILVTNRENRATTDAQPVGAIGGVPVTSNVWDISRLHRYVSSGQTRGELIVDFAEEFGEPIPVLKASYGRWHSLQ